jgi:hypothetical protein
VQLLSQGFEARKKSRERVANHGSHVRLDRLLCGGERNKVADCLTSALSDAPFRLSSK